MDCFRTIDGSPTNTSGHPPDRQYFGIGGYVGIEITIKNNARTKKDVNITMVILDELNVPINFQ